MTIILISAVKSAAKSAGCKLAGTVKTAATTSVTSAVENRLMSQTSPISPNNNSYKLTVVAMTYQTSQISQNRRISQSSQVGIRVSDRAGLKVGDKAGVNYRFKPTIIIDSDGRHHLKL